MDLQSEFQRRFGKAPVWLAHAPGRVNLLGEHVDYNDGLVLPIAIDRQVRIAAAPTSEAIATLHALDLGESVSIDLEDLEGQRDTQGRPIPYWARYPASVAWALQEAGLEVGGIQAIYTSDVPIGAGLSSSAAVEVAFAMLWQARGDWRMDRMTLARLCQRGENDYVGVASGIMDQFASAHGVAGHALYLDTRSLDWEPVPLPPGTAVVIADSGVRRNLTESAYNERRLSCQQAVELLREWIPGLESLRDVSAPEFAAYSDRLPSVVRRRAEHVVKEIARVKSAVSALQREDARTFGALMYAGHASLRDLYEVSTLELDSLVELSRQLPGCYGARLTGAGFGGCTVNLVEAAKVDEFMQGLMEGYQRRTGRQSQAYACRPSEGASVVTMD